MSHAERKIRKSEAAWKSFPYLCTAELFQMPYWTVLCYKDDTIWGDAARRWIDSNFTIHDVIFLDRHLKRVIEGK